MEGENVFNSLLNSHNYQFRVVEEERLDLLANIIKHLTHIVESRGGGGGRGGEIWGFLKGATEFSTKK